MRPFGMRFQAAPCYQRYRQPQRACSLRRSGRASDPLPLTGLPLVGRSRELDLIAHARASGAAGVVVRAPPALGNRGSHVPPWPRRGRWGTHGMGPGDSQRRLRSTWRVRRGDPGGRRLRRSVRAVAPRRAGDDRLRRRARAGGRGRRCATPGSHLGGTGPAAHLRSECVRPRDGAERRSLSYAIVFLWKDAGAERLELSALSREETDQLVEAIVGGPVESGAREWIWKSSQGNALYANELTRGALNDGVLELVSGLWRMPERRGSAPRWPS